MNVFITSDSHFSHEGACHWLRADGVTKVRPFANAEEMDEVLVERWNAKVKPTDKVYHLGDVAINRRGLAVIGRCHGRKVLLKGNHDIFKLKDYLGWFYDIRATHLLDGTILSHVPLHPSQLSRFPINVHGHLHEKSIADDPRYINVCVEHTDYAPLELSELRLRYP